MTPPAVPLRIRPMQLSDIDEVMVLEQVSFPEPWPRSLYERELRANRLSWYRVIAPEQVLPGWPSVLGQGGCWLMGDEAHIVTLAVNIAWRGRGLGKWLLLHLMAEARLQGATTITLEVRPSNAAARALYQQVGFSQIGLRKRYYPNGEDALVLELTELANPLVWAPIQATLADLNAHMAAGLLP